MFTGRIFSAIVLAAVLLAAAAPARADDSAPAFAQDKLTGDWGGARTALYNRGISFDVYYKADLWHNFSGGTKSGTRWDDNLDLKMTVDGAKAANLPGTTLFIYLLNNDGQHPNELAGSEAGIDNIEVATPAFRLYEAWLEQNLLDDRLSLRAGLYDLNTEFYVTDASGLFLGPTYGIGAEMGATGDNGPSIFPVTSLALRIAAKPVANTYVQAALLDGVPGAPGDPRGTHVELGGGDGALAVGEAGYRNDDAGHYGLGVWEYTARRPEPGAPAIRKHARGAYALAERTVYKDGGKTLSAFARLGRTAGEVEQLKNGWSTGFLATGFVPQRPDAQFGLGISGAENSGPFRSTHAPLGSAETIVELTYQDKLTPAISLQPDLQYIVRAAPAIDNCWIGGLRLGVDF